MSAVHISTIPNKTATKLLAKPLLREYRPEITSENRPKRTSWGMKGYGRVQRGTARIAGPGTKRALKRRAPMGRHTYTPNAKIRMDLATGTYSLANAPVGACLVPSELRSTSCWTMVNSLVRKILSFQCYLVPKKKNANGRCGVRVWDSTGQPGPLRRSRKGFKLR